MASATPYQGSGPADAPPTPPSAAFTSTSPRGSARRRKSPSSRTNSSLSAELCDGSNCGSNPSSPTGFAYDDGDNGSFVDHRATDDDNGSVASFVNRQTAVPENCAGKSKALVFGQFMAFVLASTGAIQSSLHLDCNLSAPTFSMFSFYFPLTVICLALLIWKEKGDAWKEKAQTYLCQWQSTLSRRESCATLSDQDGLQMQHQGTTGNNTGTADAQNGTHQATESARSKRTIRPKPEKRNHLLSRWSQDPPGSTNAIHYPFNSLDVPDRFYVEGEHAPNAQTAETKSHSFFGLFPLNAPLRTYAIIAFIDVYANYSTITAFKFTTITNVQLFDALAIPSAIIVSKIFFGRRYTKIHLLGVVVCSVGVAINFVHNYNEDKHMREISEGEETEQELLIEEEYPYKIRGDFLAILGGILFGIDNTIQEVTVKDSSLTEYLGVMTFFASIISFFQALILERQAIRDFFGQSSSATCPESQGLALFSLFSIGGVVMYAGIGFFLQFSDAAFFNLSVLTADAWAVAFSLGEGIKPPATFYAALVITVSGVFIYETAPSPVVQESVVGEIELAETENASGQEEHKEAEPVGVLA